MTWASVIWSGKETTSFRNGMEWNGEWIMKLIADPFLWNHSHAHYSSAQFMAMAAVEASLLSLCCPSSPFKVI
jgi:hypothetical protein